MTKIPAVTKVDEWTNEDTGVGAAMAAGSQDENGNWALFVIAPVMRIAEKILKFSENLIKFQLNHPLWYITIKVRINKQSPTRFVNTVNIPESSLDLLL